MTSSRGHGRLASAALAATILLTIAALLWISAIGVAAETHVCPPGPRTGEGRLGQEYALDASPSAWPPGVMCRIDLPSGKEGEVVGQVSPVLTWTIAGLGASGGVILLAGLLGEIRRRLRRVPTPRQGLAATATALIAAIALAGAGCGSDGTMSTVKMAPPEVAQKLPKLPEGWKAHRDRSVGYAIGIPPQWQLDEHGGKVLLRPPDHLVAVSLAADRNGSALSLPLDRFATQALGSLPGFKVPLHPAKPKRFKGTPLQGVETEATGTQARGLKEHATLVVLRRNHFVNYTVAVLENAERAGSKLDSAVALRMVRTLRDQPVEGRGAASAP